MALAAELRRRLSSSDFGPPEKRLRLAVQIFESPHLRVARKEEAVIEALCRQESWEALRECLQSERFSKAILRPSIRKKLVQVAARDPEQECGRLLLSDQQTSNYLAARPQEYTALCHSVFSNKPDVASLKAAISCAKRSPNPPSLAPFLPFLAEVELDEAAVRLLITVVGSEQEILDSLADNVSPNTVGLAARVVAAKYGRRHSKAEEFVFQVIGLAKSNEALGQALSAVETIEDRDKLSAVFQSRLADTSSKNLTAAFKPLAHLDILLFETLLPKLMAISIKDEALDELLVDALTAAEKEQRPHKLISKLLDGITKNNEPKLMRFPQALVLSALTWPSKNLAAAISALIFNLLNNTEEAFFVSSATLLVSLLEASKAAQHNTPYLVRDKFVGLQQQVQQVLEKFEPIAKKAAKKKHQGAFLSKYLELCFAFGELNLLLKHYAEEGTESCYDVGSTLLDFSLLLSFVSDWPDFANDAIAVDECKNKVVLLVDQKIRATTLLNLDLDQGQQEAAALMLASCPPGHLHSSLNLLRKSLSKSTVAQVADSLAASLLLNPKQQFSSHFDNCVALALLRAMKKSDAAHGVLGNLKLSNVVAPCDPMDAPDPKPRNNLMAILLAFGQLRVTDKATRLLSAAALLAACYNLKDGWDVAIPVLVTLFSEIENNFNLGKLIKFTNEATVNADESMLKKFVCALFYKKMPSENDIRSFNSRSMKPLALVSLKFLLDQKGSESIKKQLVDIAMAYGADLEKIRPSLKNKIPNISRSSPQQLTDLFKSKTVIDALAADKALIRMMQFNLADMKTVKAAAVCLNAFLTSRSALAVDRIPVIQQKLQKICAAIIEGQNEDLAVDVAHLVEGMGVAMARHRKDFSRAAPYFVADVLHLFETKNIQKSVKVHMERYMQALLRLCDEHGELFLLRASSPACQQILHAQLAEKKKIERSV
ncbi:uncharacterized protein LOC132197418 [Neocloeon triangulifer]|uniref:uncharacterized protein LOC132197418 n=1 Tax=Neocloeon triangulifer TaxID=2078957 RepID=UPI00286F550D|nr:uncharacterized protein LOC132197418 [Neocloeon triangulifer]